MPGKSGRSGRPAKPTTLHIASGTFRPDRHTGGAAPIPGSVEIPDDMTDPVAIALWGKLSSGLIAVGVLTAGDVHSFQAMCETWALWRKTYAALQADPTDKDTRIAASTYLKIFDTLAARFGLNPADRSRLKLPAQKSADPFDSFLKKKRS